MFRSTVSLLQLLKQLQYYVNEFELSSFYTAKYIVDGIFK